MEHGTRRHLTEFCSDHDVATCCRETHDAETLILTGGDCPSCGCDLGSEIEQHIEECDVPA